MRFTPSDKFLALARGAAKQVRWQVYFRRVATLGEAMTGATAWKEITSRIDFSNFPGLTQQVEWEPGQFVFDSVQLVGLGLVWFNVNVFYADAAHPYCEMKIDFSIVGASDVQTLLVGFADLKKDSNELQDNVTFTVSTAEAVGSRIAAENVTTQYIETGTNLGGADGLILRTIPALYVVDANITDYVLKVGVHKITYDYNSGSRRVKLDSGEWEDITGIGNVTIGDAASGYADTQRVTVYASDLGLLPTGTDSIEEEIVVVTAGTTLPNQWYRNVRIKDLLTLIYGRLGISTVTFGDLALNTWDGRKAIAPFIEVPGELQATTMVSDGTDLYIGRGGKVYKYTIATETFTTIFDAGAGTSIGRLFWNSRNGHLWIVYGTTSSGADYLRIYVPSTSALSAAVAHAPSIHSPFNMVLVDYAYQVASYKYGLFYVNGEGNLMQASWNGSQSVPSISLVDTTFDGMGQSIYAVDNLIYVSAIVEANDVYTIVSINSSGNFVSGGSTPRPDIGDGMIFVHDPARGKIYFSHGSVGRLHYSADGDTGITEIVNPTTTYGNSSLHPLTCLWYSDLDEKTYGIGKRIYDGVYLFFWINGTQIVVLDEYADLPDNTTTAITEVGGIIYGVDRFGRIWKYDTSMPFLADVAAFGGMTLTDALYKSLRAAISVGVIRSNKQAYVFRRADTGGTPITTGSTMNVAISDPSDITETVLYLPHADLIEVDNTSKKQTYDGTNFGVEVLSDKYTVTVQNTLIPDWMLDDYAYCAYQIFKNDRNLVQASLGCEPLMQYECMDGAHLDLASTKHGLSIDGVITKETIDKDGSMTVEVLI